VGKTHQWIIFIGRMLLGLSFLGAGLAKIGVWDQLVTQLGRSPLKEAIGTEMIPVYLVFTILLESVGGFLVCLGAKTRLAAILLVVVMIVPVTMMHQFWHLSGQAFIQGYFRFLLDVKILGGILLLMAFGPGRFSVDRG